MCDTRPKQIKGKRENYENNQAQNLKNSRTFEGNIGCIHDNDGALSLIINRAAIEWRMHILLTLKLKLLYKTCMILQNESS